MATTPTVKPLPFIGDNGVTKPFVQGVTDSGITQAPTLPINNQANQTAIVAGNLQNAPSPLQLPQVSQTPIQSPTTIFNSVMGNQANADGAPTSAVEKRLADLYKQQEADVTSLGNRGQAQLEAEKQLGIDAKQATVDSLTKQLNDLNVEAQASALATQNQPILGSIVSGQINAIERDRTVKALRLSASISAAQGDLASAQAKADKAIAAKYAPEEARLKYFTDFMNANYKELDRSDRKKADELQIKLAERKEQVDAKKKVDEDISAVLLEAAKYGADAVTLSNIQKATDLNSAVQGAGKFLSAEFNQKLAQEKFANEIQKQQLAISRGNLDVSRAELALKKGKQDAELAAASPTAKASEALSFVSTIDELLNSGQLDNVVGINRLNPFNYVPGTKVQYAKNQFNQIKGELSLENRQKLKGSGAISDFEFKILGQASSALGTNLSNADALKELKKIRGVFSTAAGLPSKVKIIDPSSGKSVVVEATRETINKALIDGANVEYQ